MICACSSCGFNVCILHSGGVTRMQLNIDKKRGFNVTVDEFFLYGSSQVLANQIGSRRALLFTTPTVHQYYGEALKHIITTSDVDGDYFVLPLTEQKKTMETVLHICETAQKAGVGRKDVLVAVGGGLCSDLITFAASMIRRGISHLRVPTTLIGQIDAGIGIKGGANLYTYKNYLGCFYPPDDVIIHPAFLQTLDAKHIRQGLAEILKIAVIRDLQLFETVERHYNELVATCFSHPNNIARDIIVSSINGMLDELQENPYEDQTYERLVDMGHTVSPLLEAYSGYTLHHGYAVSIDMAFTCMLGVEMGIMPPHEGVRFVELLKNVGLPINSPLLTLDLVQSAFQASSLHRGGNLCLPVPQKIGSCLFVRDIEEISITMINSALYMLDHLESETEFLRMRN